MLTETFETGADLRSYRVRAGVTMEDVAARAAFNYSQLSKVERGKVPVPAGWPLRYVTAVRDLAHERAEAVGVATARKPRRLRSSDLAPKAVAGVAS